jgi:hypothetical protein
MTRFIAAVPLHTNVVPGLICSMMCGPEAYGLQLMYTLSISVSLVLMSYSMVIRMIWLDQSFGSEHVEFIILCLSVIA